MATGDAWQVNSGGVIATLQVRAVKCLLYSVQAEDSGVQAYLQIFDSAAAVIAGAIPVWQQIMSNLPSNIWEPAIPMVFTNGIYAAVSAANGVYAVSAQSVWMMFRGRDL